MRPATWFLPWLLVPLGVGNKPQPVAAVRRVDATSRDNDRPAGVVETFQASEHLVEPISPNRSRNLFSHENSGPTGADKVFKVGPKMPSIGLTKALPCG
jgi:hypothetical protein